MNAMTNPPHRRPAQQAAEHPAAEAPAQAEAQGHGPQAQAEPGEHSEPEDSTGKRGPQAGPGQYPPPPYVPPAVGAPEHYGRD